LRPRPLLDVLLAAWVVVWVVAGVAVAREVRGLAQYSESARRAGLATERAGTLLETLSGLPIVGEQLREPAAAVREAGASTVEAAERGRERAESAATLLGVAIAVIPSLPLLLLYLPARALLERDRRMLRDALRAGPNAALDELLATRAVARLPYRRLRAVSADPTADLAEGRHARLAEAELERLGLRRG